MNGQNIDKEAMIRRLGSLVQLDIDAVHAYTQAIERIDDMAIRQELTRFRDDHNRHVAELSTSIRDLGGDPPQYARDFKGFFIEGFTALRSITGTEGALSAMRTNEVLTNSRYGEARSESFTPAIREIIERSYMDEVHHLRYIEDALNGRIWEKK